MATASWDEIRRLASDLQRAQLGSTAKKLSERNCIEVVFKLSELGLVNLIHTIDGKEYITRQYFATEIKNECLGNGGRIGLVELSQTLNVDYQVVENAANEIVKKDNEYFLSIGQLISKKYLENICEELNLKLEEEGKIRIADVTNHYDLPTDILTVAITSAIGTTIKGVVDSDEPGLIYTPTYVQSQKAIIRGALSGLTKVTTIRKVLSVISVPPHLFFSLVEELIAEGQVSGSLSGGKHPDRALFIPNIYSLLVQSYAKDFFNSNGFVDFNALRKLGITDVDSYMKQVLPANEFKKLTHLPNYALSSGTWDEIGRKAEEEMKSTGWFDSASLLPSAASTSEADITATTQLLHKLHSDWKACNDVYLYLDSLRSQCLKTMEPLVTDKAKKEAPSVLKSIQANKNAPPEKKSNNNTNEEDDWKNEGKGKGKKGAKGKGKKGGGKDSGNQGGPGGSGAGGASNNPSSTINNLEFMPSEDLVQHLVQEEVVGECPEEIISEIVEELATVLNGKYRSEIQSVFLTSQAETINNQKKSHGDFKATITTLYRNIIIFDQGAGLFEDSMSGQLRGFLLKSLCNDAANLALSFISSTPNPDKMTPKIADATIENLESSAAKDAFKKLFASLTGKKEELDEFLEALEEVGSPGMCGLNLRPPDKKLRSEMVEEHKKVLLNELEECKEAAGGLLLVLLLLFIHYHPDHAIHASGKFVPHIASFLVLKSVEDQQMKELITDTQALVVKSLKNKGQTEIADELAESFEKLKSETTRLLNS